jgi:hypothetical protein
MRHRSVLILSSLFALLATKIHAQDLSPRAYVITPIHTNAVILTWAFFDGGVDFNGAVPISGATGTYNVPIFSLYHTLNFFGRSANLTASLPYAVGNFTGSVMGQQQSIYRSGLLDTSIRFSINLKGGPAMTPQVYSKWKQKTLIGLSVKIVAPTGQYEPTKLVNWGINRWAFKPELGYSKHWNHWVLDGYGGAWFYTTNPASFNLPLPQPQSQAPIGSLEGHLSYDLKPRYWVSLDGNFWWGGVTTLNGIQNLQTRQTSSRIGATGSVPLGKHQSIKISYSNGTYIRFGGNYQNVSVAWQYSWLGRPE